MTPLPAHALPPTVRARFLDGINGLRMHVLEAGFETPGRPCVLLLHGFPELAWSWRKIIPPLAAAGFHVIAPDQRGYGRTAAQPIDYGDDLSPFRIPNLVADALALVRAAGHASVALLAGHDFGAFVAAWCALIRPDVFRAVALLSAPFAGPPELRAGPPEADIHAALAALARPRKHYQWYYATPQANADMWHCPQGVHAFLRAYYHHKSADWPGNRPFPLAAWRAEELAKMPTYYVMDRDRTMAETVAAAVPDTPALAPCRWLTEPELALYAAEFVRTGFQGGLQFYRYKTGGAYDADLRLYAGRTIDVPSLFIAGRQDWGIYQVPGALERMQQSACRHMAACHLIESAGHWVQQEQPEKVASLLLEFLQQQNRPGPVTFQVLP